MLNIFKAMRNFVTKLLKPVAPKVTKSAVSKSSSSSASKTSMGISGAVTKTPRASRGTSVGAVRSSGTRKARDDHRRNGDTASMRGSKRKPPLVTPVDSELLVAASGSRLGQSVLRRLQHEGKPIYASNEDFLKAHAHYGWSKWETAQVNDILNIYARNYEQMGLFLQGENEIGDGVITIPGIGPVAVQGYWVSTPNGPVFIAGSFVTSDDSRKAIGSEGIATYIPELQSETLAPYLGFVASNQDVFLRVAHARLAELQNIINSLPADVLNNLPPYALEELRNLTPEEVASRMASIPMTMNVSGWTDQLAGKRRQEVPQFLATLQLGLIGIIPPEDMAVSRLLGSNRSFGDLQSTGFMELRYSQFQSLLAGSEVDIQDETVRIAGFDLDYTASHYFPAQSHFGGGYVAESQSTCQENPLYCYEQYINAGVGNIVSTSTWTQPNNLDAQILAELEGARLVTDYLRYVSAWQDPQRTANFDPQRPESYWYMSSPTAFAINQARVGLANEIREPFMNSDDLQMWGYHYRIGQLYFRGVFGSRDVDSLLEYEDFRYNQFEG